MLQIDTISVRIVTKVIIWIFLIFVMEVRNTMEAQLHHHLFPKVLPIKSIAQDAEGHTLED